MSKMKEGHGARKNYQGEGGGGSGRTGFDSELKPGLGGVEGRGRLSRENCF